ncbi:hypothetical protein Tco_0932075 [Tanacetum coccineum]
MVTYLEKTDGNVEFYEIIDFLIRSSIHYALTVSPVVFTTFVEQFWMTAKSKTINNVRIDVLPNQAIFDTIQLMGYEEDLNTLTFNKGLFSPQWKFLFHTIIHCLSSKSTSWDQIPTNIATAVICFATNQVYDFSKLIFDEDEGAVSKRPSETQPTPSHTHPSEDQSELQPDPFLRPSSSNLVPDFIPEGSGGNHGDLKAQIKQLKKKAKPVISHHNAWIKSVSIKKRLARKKSLKTKLMQKDSVSKQGRKPAKSEPTVHKDPPFDDLDDAMDYMKPEDAHDEGIVKDSKETRVSTEEQVSTDKLKVSTDKPNEGTVEPNEGTAEPKDGNSDESASPITVFRDDETIAQFLVTMSQNKTKQKGFEIKDTNRPRTTTERSILTLKPLPKIDPKDKGKKVLKEKAESDAESEGEEWEAEEEKKKLAEEEATKAVFTNEYDFIQARLNADKILTEKLQEEEREKFTIEQRAKFLHDTIAAQRRFLAQQRC